jgi:nitrogen regulatory protein PII-like uncharacterized protein
MADDIPSNYQDWLDLFRVSIDQNINIILNLNNKGIAKASGLIEYENLDPKTNYEMKISEEKKAMISILENEKASEIAIRMIQANESIEKIVKYTDLDPATIEKLINQLNYKH